MKNDLSIPALFSNNPWLRIGVVILLVCGTIGACYVGQPPSTASEAGVLMQLPSSIGKFWGTDQEVSEAERVILPPDTEFAKKIYGNGLGDNINCQIVLAGAEKRSIHRPEICLPGQGWTLKTGRVIPIKLKNGHTLNVKALDIARPIPTQDGTQKELNSIYIYWFVGKDATTPDHVARILKTNMDMLLHNINHRWAYIIVSAPVLQGFVPGGKDYDQTLGMLENFISEMAPDIMLAEKTPRAE